MALYTRVENWMTITLSEGDSFASALRIMSQGGYQLALVVREEGRFAGMITDSDIRKALLKGVNVEESVKQVMNTTPLVVSPELGDLEAHQLMLLNHYFHLPIVDQQGCLVGLHVAEQLRTPKRRSEPLVIMAGGRGKRLMPLTANTPKPMLPIHGKPILEHIVDRAKQEGFEEIVISVNYLAEIITDHFADGSSHGVNIQYLHENEPLGTAGALATLPKHLHMESVVVTNADVITDVSYGEMLDEAKRSGCDGLMAVRLQEWQNPFGVIHSKGTRLVGLEEKPVTQHHVNAGMYVLAPPLLNLLEVEQYCDMTDLFVRGLERGLDLQIFPLHESWLDIGRPDDYQAAGGSLEH